MDTVRSHWSKRSFAPGQVAQWAAVQSAFETHYMAVMPQLDIPSNRTAMMLVMSRERGGKDTLFMALPEGQKAYAGFEPAEFGDIPSKPDLLAGDQIGYDQLFNEAVEARR